MIVQFFLCMQLIMFIDPIATQKITAHPCHYESFHVSRSEKSVILLPWPWLVSINYRIVMS